MTRALCALVLVAAAAACSRVDLDEPGKGKRATGGIVPGVFAAPAPAGVELAPPPPAGFAPQVRLGLSVGDQWEPAIAADRFGHVYMLYPQYRRRAGLWGLPEPDHAPADQ